MRDSAREKERERADYREAKYYEKGSKKQQQQ